MTPAATSTGTLNSLAEDLFMELFCDTFGPEKSQHIYIQYPFTDIYGNSRLIDFAIESNDVKIAIEIDGETWHNPSKVSQNKYTDDLLKQNSMVHQNWRVFRWVYNQLQHQPDKVKDELRTYLGEHPLFKELDDYLPRQKGRTIQLKEHQQEALNNLEAMRLQGETIALLFHATGTGKTTSAVSDAKRVGKRTLMLAHTKELVKQAAKTFRQLWPEVNTGLYLGNTKEPDAHVVCASIQSLVQNLHHFTPEAFGYLIIDEAHHAVADSYKKVLSYFHTDFTLGLTATPERSDGINMLENFQNVAHKLDLKTAVEMGELAPIRCIRIKTNVDLSSVRINGIKYNSQDLESKLFVPERNRLILDTWQQYVKNKKTVIFCASVAHATEIAALFREAGIRAEAVSGTTKSETRNQVLQEYEEGGINLLCACDLLNEGWDSPRTEVLFMARPTLSKTLYLQQLGRGMRKYLGKESLVVFDFIDNANLFNMPYSVHRIFDINKYKPGEYVIESSGEYQTDRDLMARGEKPTAWLDFPISITDYEHIDLFNWQVEVKDMISQLEFVRMVDVQTETIEKYLREDKIKADLEVPLGDKRSFKYFREETVKRYAKQFGWDLITAANMKDKFMDFIKPMNMSYSFKPVLLKAMLALVDDKGKVKLEDIVDYFIDFYEDRREKGLIVEKERSIYARGGYTRKEVERNILSNPFKRFEDMRFMKRCRDVEYVEFNHHVFKHLTEEEKRWMVGHCDDELEEYFSRLF